MNVKKQYMKLFKKNIYLNKEKKKNIIEQERKEVESIMSKYDEEQEAFNEEMEGAIPKAHRLTKENANYVEDMGIVNVIKFLGKVPHFNIKSKMQIGNLPLFHITSGYNPQKGDYDVSRGIISIGSKARGVIAIGKLAYGLIAIGGKSIGVLSVGILSAAVFAVAGIAFALLLALGGISISAVASLGIVALSSLAASGQVALANFVKTGQKVSENIPGWFEIMANNMGNVVLIFELILIAILVLIFYFNYYSKYKYDE
jgi:hypothetical protein